MLQRSVNNIRKGSASKQRRQSKMRYEEQEGKKPNLKKRRENFGLKSEWKEDMFMCKKNLKSGKDTSLQSTLTDGQANLKQNNFLHLNGVLYLAKFLTR